MGNSTFRNPIMKHAADPWMYKHKDGYYYFMVTKGDRLDLWRSKAMSDIASGDIKTVWRPPEEGINCRNLWAPELHYLNEKWYIYYTANDGGGDDSRKIFVLENAADDPLEGHWVERGFINTEHPGLDGTVFEHKGVTYFLYAGYGHFPDYGSAIYIAMMENPWTIKGPDVLLTKPEFEWEKQGGMAINEGPVVLKRNGKLFLIYSASATWSEDYSLGMLYTEQTNDVMNAGCWVKVSEPVFKKNARCDILGPGHNSFTHSPDGMEDWIVYHAFSNEVVEGMDKRHTHIQKFGWTSDGFPDFGEPESTALEMPAPSGEQSKAFNNQTKG